MSETLNIILGRRNALLNLRPIAVDWSGDQPRNKGFTNPEKSTSKNPGDRKAFEASVAAAVKVHFGDNSSQIGNGVIFYNSSNATIYDKNKKMEKITLGVTANGIKGAWKLK